jgi:cholesterol oxidase
MDADDQVIEGRTTMIVKPRRPLRLPPARILSVLTEDGVELRLQRLRGGDRGPVVLAAGYAMSARVFTLDTVETNLAEYLCAQGFDVWLLSWRSSPDVAACTSRFTLDDVAWFDWPAAIESVLAHT